MAYDKVVDSAKLDAALTATAEAIRAKSGKTSTFYWNASTGFSNAVNQIDAIVDPICEFRYPARAQYPEAMILHGYKEIPMGFGDDIASALKDVSIQYIDFSGSPNCTMIRGGAFHDFKACRELYLPENIERIESDAFYNLWNLETLNLSGGALRIGMYAFAGLSGLKKIAIGCDILDADRAFANCDAVEAVWISGRCQTIVGSPFAMLPNITIYAEAPRRPEGWRDGFDTTSGGQATVIYGQARPW